MEPIKYERQHVSVRRMRDVLKLKHTPQHNKPMAMMHAIKKVPIQQIRYISAPGGSTISRVTIEAEKVGAKRARDSSFIPKIRECELVKIDATRRG